MNKIICRLCGRTPRFFRVLRNTGLVLGTVATAILTSPVALPAAAITAAGYLAVGAGVLSAVSQLTLEGE